jgi:hypothetical protein
MLFVRIHFTFTINVPSDMISMQWLDGVISHIWLFWPACHMIRGMPCYSETNGGVERSNWLVENKIGLWMRENKSQHWSVGLPLVQWEMNTQTHRGIGGKIPYCLFTGQNPCVDVSSLPTDPKLIEKLNTEAQVSALLELNPDILLKDAIVKSYHTAREAGTVLPPTQQPMVQQPTTELMPVFNPPIATPPDVFYQVIPAANQNPFSLADQCIDDVYNGDNTNTHHDNMFETSPQYGSADVEDVFAANHTTEEIEPPAAQEVAEDDPATQDLKKDATTKAVETVSSSLTFDDSDKKDI